MGRGPSREASHIGRFPRGGFELLAIVSCFLSTFGCSIAQFDLCGLRHRAGHNGRTAHTPSALGILAAHQMSATGPSAPELARTGDLDPLAQALVGLLFRHLCHPFIEKPSATLLGAPLCGGTFPYGKAQAGEFTRSAATGQHLNRRSRQKNPRSLLRLLSLHPPDSWAYPANPGLRAAFTLASLGFVLQKHAHSQAHHLKKTDQQCRAES